jgi:citrate lyase beta subunit
VFGGRLRLEDLQHVAFLRSSFSKVTKPRGSFTVDGKMIDIPVIDRARRLLARHDAIERRFKKV